VPRHGSAAPVADVDSVNNAPRGSSMAGWSIRRKLGLVVTIPLVVLLVGGAVLVASLGAQYRQTHTAKVYADAMQPLLSTGVAINAELVSPLPSGAALTQARQRTDAQVRALKPVLNSLESSSSSDSSQLPQRVDRLRTKLAGLGNLRNLVDGLVRNRMDINESPQAASAATDMATTLSALITNLSSELVRITPDRDTASSAALVSAMNAAFRAAYIERQTFDGVLNRSTPMTFSELSTLNRAIADQDQALASAKVAANPQLSSQLMVLDNQSGQLSTWRQTVENRLLAGSTAKGDVNAWNTFADQRIASMVQIADATAATTQASASGTERTALIRVGAVTGAVLLTLLLVTALLATIARSVTVPLRRLRAGAVEVASVQLPAATAACACSNVAFTSDGTGNVSGVDVNATVGDVAAVAVGAAKVAVGVASVVGASEGVDSAAEDTVIAAVGSGSMALSCKTFGPSLNASTTSPTMPSRIAEPISQVAQPTSSR
jgi:hypothetical protein